MKGSRNLEKSRVSALLPTIVVHLHFAGTGEWYTVLEPVLLPEFLLQRPDEDRS